MSKGKKQFFSCLFFLPSGLKAESLACLLFDHFSVIEIGSQCACTLSDETKFSVIYLAVKNSLNYQKLRKFPFFQAFLREHLTWKGETNDCAFGPEACSHLVTLFCERIFAAWLDAKSSPFQGIESCKSGQNGSGLLLIRK